MSNIMNDEVKKWTATTNDVISRLEDTLAHAKEQLAKNQQLFNDSIHQEKFNEEIALMYIQAMNSLIESIKSLETLIHATKLGMKKG